MNISLPTVGEVSVADISTVELNGSGVLDKLLQVQRLHLTREFTDGRIQGKEYSDVFVKSYLTTLSESIKLALSKEEQGYQLSILEAQRLKLDKEIAQVVATTTDIQAGTAIKEYQLGTIMPLEAANLEKTGLAVEAQTAKLVLETTHMAERHPHEIDLLVAQIAKMLADTLLAEKQLLLADKELSLKDKELLLREKELELAIEQLALSRQKVITEKAQTDPSVIEEGSVIDMNNKVLGAQVDGFKRDAEQKAANTLLQTWIVRLNNDAALTNDANMLKDNYIGRAVEKMMEGVGMSVEGKDEADLT